MRKMLSREYRSSVELMLGPEAGAAATPPEDQAQDGFDAVGASILSLPPDAIELLERSATDIADATIANPATLAQVVPCVTGSQDAACYEEVATVLGRYAFRHPLDAGEIDRLTDIGLAGQQWDETGNFMSGLKYELMAILQSPSFLYISEVGEADPQSGYRRLTANELASRMSFFLLGRTPELELLDLAESGGLAEAAQVREVAQKMMASPEARVALASFFDELLRLRSLATVAKNAEVFPLFTPELGEAMRQESLLLVHDIVWNQDTDYRNLFNANYTFVNDPLAALYDIPEPGTGEVFTKVDWPESQNRAGYMSQASFLTWQSGPLRNSPSKRGKYVQEMILCNEVPPPDPNAELDLPEPEENQTLKELLEQHMENDGCKSCHANFDPIGFAYEFYDGIGAYRTTDNGGPISANGEIVGIGAWNNARELGEVLAADARTARCLIENFIRGSLGHAPTKGERPGIDALDADFAESGYSVKSLLVEMVTSPVFQLVDEPK
jgi:hypothetical protein